MGLTLQEVLVTALKKLEEKGLQRFIEKLSVWEVREEYKKIPKDELLGKDPEHVAGLINDYYNYSYGAEVTLAVLEEIGEKKVREELQHDLRTDTSGHGLGTAMYTDRVKFIDDHRSDLIRMITDVDPVLCDLRDQKLLTQEQYNNVMEKRTFQEKMEKLCDIMRHWEDTEKYTAYTVLRKYNEEIIRDLETEERMWKYGYSQRFRDRVNFIDDHRSDLIRRITDVDPFLCDLWDQKLLTQEQYDDVMEKRTSQEKMEKLCDIIRHWEDTEKYTAYTVLRKYNKQIIRDQGNKGILGRRSYFQPFRGRDHFVIRYRSHLINDIKEVDPVLDDLRSHNLLTEGEYKDLQAMPTPKEKMSRLCEIFRYQSDTEMDQFYISLWRYNYTVIHNLEISENLGKSSDSKTSAAGDHFIDRHREELIGRIKIVRPVIDDLYSNNLLTGEEWDYIIDTPESEDMMRRLYDIIRYWDDEKEKVYDALYMYNPRVIDFLINPRDSSSLDKTGDHFIDRHREELIGRIKIVRPVIDDLYNNNLLTGEEWDYIIETPESEDRMRRLYDIIRYLDDDGKRKVYAALYKYNPRVIAFLIKPRDSSPLDKTGDHFIDRHREELIGRIKIVRPVISDLYQSDLLTGEERDYIKETSEPEDRMRRLYDIIRYWDDDEKEKVYAALYKYNPRVIDFLINPRDSSSLDKTGDHFIDRHREELIGRIKIVRPVISDLYSNNLLTGEEREYIMETPEPEDRMRRLYDIIRYWDDDEKEKVYDALYKYSSNVIDFLINPRDKTGDHFIDRHRKYLIERIRNVRPVIDDLYSNNLLTGEERDYIMRLPESAEKMRCLYDIIRYWDDDEKEKVCDALIMYNPSIMAHLAYQRDQSPSDKNVRPVTKMPRRSDPVMKKNDRSCELCGTPQESGKVITPTMTGSTYSLSMDSPGLFCCSETEIQFQVTRPVTIEYEVDTWSNYDDILQNLQGGYEIIGPLFNIKSQLDPDVVSAVYLPHCLCLGGFKEDESLIKCFHYKDDNLVLETPSRLEPMYAVLENPTFSCIGTILYPLSLLTKEIRAFFRYHGMVLLFYKTITLDNEMYNYILHLFLLPWTSTVMKAVEQSEMKVSFQRIPKPPQTKSVYSKKSYRINGPQIASIIPGTLDFEGHFHSEIFSFTEISMEGKTNTKVKLSVHPEDEDITVWEAVVSAVEMLASPSTMTRLTNQPGGCRLPPEQSVHFLDEHRADLIRMISEVNSVLDDLQSPTLLSNEHCATVRSQMTNPEKMRKLYDYITAWGNDDKDKVYNALRKHNYPVIKKLQNEVPADDNKPEAKAGRLRCILN
ncbi:uncharacterized protein [Dendropsophus ebraccatus]|uniref:uncharacterized protein isoform X2 n=1 Tax=Dendropsophus ebraccatus TaxID=150705 RepID=UPI003831391E